MSVRLTRLSFLVLAALGTVAMAATTDRQAPIRIQADQAHYARQTNTSIFSGNVVLEQAGLTLHGSKLTVTRNQKDGTTRAMLVGDPAHLRKQPDDEDDPPITGHAQTMQYNSTTHELILKGDAVINRAGDSVHSSVIHHNLETGVTQAGGEQGKGQGRVHIILQTNHAAPSASNTDTNRQESQRATTAAKQTTPDSNAGKAPAAHPDHDSDAAAATAHAQRSAPPAKATSTP